MRRIITELEQVSVGTFLSKLETFNIRGKVELESHLDMIRNGMCMELVGFFTRKDWEAHTSTEAKGSVHYPADWWQAFKARWFPLWMQRRFPVREKEVPVSFKHVTILRRICPHLKVPNDTGPHLVWLIQDESRDDEIRHDLRENQR